MNLEIEITECHLFIRQGTTKIYANGLLKANDSNDSVVTQFIIPLQTVNAKLDIVTVLKLTDIQRRGVCDALKTLIARERLYLDI